jgi:hypothetical protein
LKVNFSESYNVRKILWLSIILFLFGCGGGGSAPFNSAAFNLNSTKHLYVASGSCYGGGVTVSAGPTNTIAKFNLQSGQLEQVVIDYNEVNPGDSPVAIADYDSTRLLVLVENAAGRRLDLVNKDGSGSTVYLVNNTGLNAVLRSVVLLADLSVLVSKSSAIEKFNSSKSRLLIAAKPWVNAPVGSCATSTTLISSMTVHSSGKIVYTHAAASPNNKIGVISATGYAAGADCLSAQVAPSTTALPTRAIFASDGKLLVSFGSTTAASNAIYSYDFDGGTGAISGGTSVYEDSGVTLNGPSSMAQDPESGDIFVANVNSLFNTVERFHYANNALIRATTKPFLESSAYTRCVSDLKVMN